MKPFPEFTPAEDDIIYHYCDANAFLSICSNRTLRLSDVYFMNDSLEMYWSINLFEEFKEEFKETFGEEFINIVASNLKSNSYYFKALACCFSQNGDLLSQWRAYADDGNGFAIGLNAKKLFENLPYFDPVKVLYDKALQIEYLRSTLEEIYQIYTSHSSIDFYTIPLPYQFVGFKNPAFQEEAEIRLVKMAGIEHFSHGTTLQTSYFNPNNENEIIEIPIKFRMRNNIPVAFVDQKFIGDGFENPIAEIVIGPKNAALVEEIDLFLGTIGLGKINIRKSNASYR